MEPISNDTIAALLKTVIPDAEIQISGDGYKYQALIISATFAGLNTVKRHQKVYAALREAITGGALHALTLKTLTPEEFAQSATS
jgi:acid stress-induced BolA-like protein IbaG/YrbA